jgi:hypothetical protein
MVIERSEVFPASVVAYRDGALELATLRRFREGLVNASQTPMGRQLLTLWKLTSFEPVPDDYAQTLANILRSYPPPPSQAAHGEQSRGKLR